MFCYHWCFIFSIVHFFHPFFSLYILSNWEVYHIFCSLYWISYPIASVLCFGFMVTRHVGSYLPTRDRTHTLWIGRWSVNHWTAREVLIIYFLKWYCSCSALSDWCLIQELQPELNSFCLLTHLHLDYKTNKLHHRISWIFLYKNTP